MKATTKKPRWARARLLASLAALSAPASAWPAQAVVLYEGDLTRPAAGLHLGATPLVLAHDLAGDAPERPGVRWLAPTVRASLAPDWRTFVLSGREEERTWVQAPAGPRSYLEGRPRLLWAGGDWLAVPDAEAGPRASLHLLSENGAVLGRVPAQAVEWAAATSARLVLGTSVDVRVLERASGKVLPLLAEPARLGALSTTGDLLALERAEGERATLVLLGLDGPAPTARTAEVAPGQRLRFDPAGTRLLHLAPSEALVLAVDAELRKVLEIRLEEGWSWRGAAFDATGKLALGRLRVVRQPRRAAEDAANPFRPGEARVAVELFERDAAHARATVEWSVPLWNHAAPELAFAPDGRLFAHVWPSVFEVRP